MITADCLVGRNLKIARVLTVLLGGPITLAVLVLLLAIVTGTEGGVHVMGGLGRR